MDEQPVTRLGPDSGGHAPGEAGTSVAPGGVHVYSGNGARDEHRRPGLPWIGIFLLVFGGLLLIQQVLPQAESAGSLSCWRSGWRSSSSGPSTAARARSMRARSSPRSPCPAC